MKKLIAVGLFALLVGFVFCAAAARVYMDHDTVAIKSLLFGLVDVIVGVVLLRKAYIGRKERRIAP
jgi:hypothetical protein